MIDVCTYVHMCVCMYVMCICMYERMHMHEHTYDIIDEIQTFRHIHPKMHTATLQKIRTE